MNVEEFVKTVTLLNNYFPTFELNQTQTKAWYGIFKDVDVKTFKQACRHYAMNERYTPTIKGLLDAVDQVKEIMNPDIALTADEAWTLCRNAISKHSVVYDQQKYLEYIKSQDEVAHETIVNFIADLKNATNDSIQFIGNRFKEAYKTYKKRSKTKEKYQALTGGNLQIGDKE